jgi:ERCC4-type nuclease
MSSDFSAAANKAQIIKRIQTMAHYYERSMLIIEVDRGAQDVTRTRHMDSLLCLIFQARHTRVFYSDNQTETAKILKDLATSEDRKGARLPSPAVKV